MKFNYIYYSKQFVMHCDTKEKAEIFGRYLNSVGLRWSSGNVYDPDNMRWSSEYTCYRFRNGTFGSIETYRDEGHFNILEFDEFDWSAFGWITNTTEIAFSFDEFMDACEQK